MAHSQTVSIALSQAYGRYGIKPSLNGATLTARSMGGLKIGSGYIMQVHGLSTDSKLIYFELLIGDDIFGGSVLMDGEKSLKCLMDTAGLWVSVTKIDSLEDCLQAIDA